MGRSFLSFLVLTLGFSFVVEAAGISTELSSDRVEGFGKIKISFSKKDNRLQVTYDKNEVTFDEWGESSQGGYIGPVTENAVLEELKRENSPYSNEVRRTMYNVKTDRSVVDGSALRLVSEVNQPWKILLVDSWGRVTKVIKLNSNVSLPVGVPPEEDHDYNEKPKQDRDYNER